MFDKTFFKFALGFTAVIAFGMGVLYFANQARGADAGTQTATVR